MQPERWKIVERLLNQGVGATGPLILAVAPAPLEVVLYEAPVLVSCAPPHNPLRGFIQEAISLLDHPTAAHIAEFFYLPQAVVELVLGNLQQLGGVTRDAAGRWSVPQGAPRFGTDQREPTIWRRTRRLLCYWPERQRLLPVLPRMRLRDLVVLGVHKLHGELPDWYSRIASWSDAEAAERGRPKTVRVLPLSNVRDEPRSDPVVPELPDESVSLEDVLVSRCHLDVVALTWCAFRSGIWEVVSRLWSRPTPARGDEGGPFAPGEPVLGLSLPEQLLDNGSSLDDLGKLFDFQSESWRTLLSEQEDLARVRRVRDEDMPALLVVDHTDDGCRLARWRGLKTRLAGDARLLCFLGSPAQSASLVRG